MGPASEQWSTFKAAHWLAANAGIRTRTVFPASNGVCDLNHKMAPSAILSFVTAAATPHAQHFSEMAFYDNWGSF